MVQMFLMQTIPQSAEQEKFVLKRIISSICFRGMLTLKLKYSTVEINMVNYFTAKPYNGDNPYHKELFYFPKNQIQSIVQKQQWEIALVALCHFVLQLIKPSTKFLITTIKVVQILAARPAYCRVHIIESVPDQERKLKV